MMMTLLNAQRALNARNIKLVHVVAIDRQYCIGKDNGLAWHIPEDLKHFKEITTGGVVLMGRKTFESMGKPLPNRINWVITRDVNWTANGVKVAHHLGEALMGASSDIKNSITNHLFIIGGGEIYRQSIGIVDVLEMTRVDLDIQGDAFYPPIPNNFVLNKSQKNVSKDGINFTFETYYKHH